MTLTPGHHARLPRTDPGQPDAPDDHSLAAELAESAGASLLAMRERLGFADTVGLRAAGDRTAQQLLAERLAQARPDDSVLSEEAPDSPTRLTAARVWIIDPLDGTREYAEQGRVDWAVHVALWEHEGLSAGAVALPARGVTLRTGPARPRSLRPLDPAKSLRVAVSRTRPPEVAQHVAAELGAELVPMGSSGAKAAAVILGEVDAYLHAGGQYEWDSAAPVAVAVAAGLHASRLDGSALRYNQPDPYLPDLLVCLPQVAVPILELIAARQAPG